MHIGFVLLFLLLLSLGVLLGRLSPVLLLGYVLLSLLTYAVYWWDKRKAQTRQWRTPESTLQWLSLLGGWPGALLAQRYLRHKSKKQAFRVVFWLAVSVNLIVLSYLIAKG